MNLNRTLQSALLLFCLCCVLCCEKQADPPQISESETALAEGRIDDARRLIDEGQREAADSDTYYRYEVLRSKLYFAIMQPDSFLQKNRTLGQYLARQKGRESELLRWMQVQYEMQLGVFECKMLGRMDSSLAHHLRVLQLCEQQPGLRNERLLTLTNLADAYKQLGQYDESVNYYRRAMELGDSLDMTLSTEATICMGIASTYTAMRSFDESAVWWERAAQMEPQMQPTERFNYLNNRGNDLYLQQRYEESLQYFLRLDSLYGDNPNTEWERMFGRTNLADVYLKLGHPEKALPLQHEVVPFFEKQQLWLVLYYLRTQHIETAMLYGNTAEALELAGRHDTLSNIIPEQRLLRQEVLCRLYEQTGHWKELTQTMKAYEQLKDSIAGDLTKMRFSAALMNYEHDKQMLEKEQQIEEQQLSNRWTIGVAVALFILLTIIYLQRRHVQRLKEQEMRNQIGTLRMETVRNRITPHFISNALSAEILAQMNGQTVDLNPLVQLLHRGIEMTGCEQTTLAEELEFIRYYCGIESRSVGDDFELRIELAPDIDATQVRLPSMAVQILVENAIKHGLKRKPREPGKKRFVSVQARREGSGTRVLVSDNGVGLPEERQRSEHTGLRVVRQTILLLNEQNTEQMEFALDNYQDPDGTTGCRASLLLPDSFEYIVRGGGKK